MHGKCSTRIARRRSRAEVDQTGQAKLTRLARHPNSSGLTNRRTTPIFQLLDAEQTSLDLLADSQHIRYDLVASSAMRLAAYPAAEGDVPVGNNPVSTELPMNDVTTDRWLSVGEIAAYLGVKRFTCNK